jgi:hopanoid C-3 methylase HpnR
MYTKIYLRLEPLGLELVAAAVRRAGHQVQLIDLQAETHKDYWRLIDEWQPDVVAFSCNYLANVPEIVDLAKLTRARRPGTFVFVGGHSASFIAQEFLEHAGGAINCILKGEGEASVVELFEAIEHDRRAIARVPGVVTLDGEGPPPGLIDNLDTLMPARDLLRHRRRYFIGTLDPCASIEFARGCPWDCSFCSAWTFYGRSYRVVSPERAVDDLASFKEPGVFIVDDVAFVQAKHGFEIGEAIARRGIRKKYYLETRGDVLLRNREVFKFWTRLGLQYMFLGLEAIDEEGLLKFRKRISLGKAFEALEFARSLGITVAINLIADPEWDRERFEVIRQWCLEIPEIVNISVNTPYPGTETWHTEARRVRTRDYRLYDIQHAVLPTRLPLRRVLRGAGQHAARARDEAPGLGRAVRDLATIVLGQLARGQTNFFRACGSSTASSIPAAAGRPPSCRALRDEAAAAGAGQGQPRQLYVLHARGRSGRAIDDATEQFVDATRDGQRPSSAGSRR